MRAGKRRFGLLVGSVALVVAGMTAGAQTVPARTNKVIIYPAANESLDQLLQSGVEKIHDYGAYWLVRATDEQLAALQARFGARAVKAGYLNVIELNAGAINTVVGEPPTPGGLREVGGAGKRLRLIQFQGPVLSEWLDQVKAVGQVKVLFYIPNGAYLVWVDDAAERSLQKLMAPHGPIHWMGVYHPGYKLRESLLQATNQELAVEVTLVPDELVPSTAAALQRFNLDDPRAAGAALDGSTVHLRIRPGDLPAIARFPNVIWIDQIHEAVPKDEKQGLILINQTNSLVGGVAPGNRYIDFLTNTVGFTTNSFAYPVVDLADGIIGESRTKVLTDFMDLGIPTNASRLAGIIASYPWPPGYGYGFPPYDRHANFVASLMTGYATCQASYTNADVEERHFSRSGVTVDFCVPFEDEVTLITNPPPTFGDCSNSHPGPPRSSRNGVFCTIVPEGFVACNSFSLTNAGNQCCSVIPLMTWNYIVTNRISLVNQDGYQIRMGISPFGRFNNNAIFDRGRTCWITLTTEAADRAARVRLVMRNGYITGRARISNNSWGVSADGAYEILAQTYDIMVRDALSTGSIDPPTPGPAPLNQEITCVFAAGDDQGIGGVGGFGDVLVSTPASAKNVISVGASEMLRLYPETCAPFPGDSDNPDDIAWLSSAGPTVDGRFKPEIVAPGTSLFAPDPTSTNSTLAGACFGNLQCGSGTSFAAPAVSGAAQLLWWYFQNRLLQLQPSPAMTKAYVCNSARHLNFFNPLTGAMDTLPSIAQGMGILDLQRMFDGVPRVLRDQSAPRAIDFPLIITNPVPQQTYFTRTGQSYELKGQVFDATQPFRVTLAWTDAAGNPAVFKQLVDDLDLEVSIGGKTYRGNVFLEGNSIPNDIPSPRNVPDDLNNMESVFLPAGQTGNWQVVVKAIDIAGKGVPNVGDSLNQDFALVVYNGTNPSDAPNPATNDTCQTALPITSFPYVLTNSLVSPTYHNVHPSPSAGRGGIEGFWTIGVPPGGTIFSVNTAGSSIPTVLSVWKGDACGALTEVISTVLPAPIKVIADGTNNYFIVVDGFNGAEGQFTLSVVETVPDLTATPASVDFGNQPVGVASAPRTVVISNNGISPLVIGTVLLAGIDPGDFIINTNLCTGNSLLPGNACGVSLSFRPTALLGSTAELRIQSTDLSSLTIVPLTGNGVKAEAIFTFIDPITQVLADSLDFGHIPVNISLSKSIIVTNGGTASMVITDTHIVGAGSDFKITQDGCIGTTIRPGGSCLVGIQFKPSTGGLRQSMLSVTSTDSVGLHQLPLSGQGDPLPTALVFIPSGLDFSAMPTGQASAAQSVLVSNKTVDTVAIGTTTVIGESASDFKVTKTSCIPSFILTNNTCSIEVSFTPQAKGFRQAAFSVSNTGGTPSTFPVTGTGIVASAAELIPAALAFDSVPLGTTGVFQKVTLRNTGNDNLTVNDVILTGDDAGEFVVLPSNCRAGSIPPNGTCEIDVALAPTTPGLKLAQLTVIHTGLGDHQVALTSGVHAQPDARINLKGTSFFIGQDIINATGIGQTIEVTTTNGALITFYIKIKNEGNVPDQFVVAGPAGTRDFTVTYLKGKAGTSNITASVTVPGGAYTNDSVAAGTATPKNSWIRMEVQTSVSALSGNSITIPVIATSVTDLSADTVQAIVRTQCETNPVVAIDSVPFDSGGMDMRSAGSNFGPQSGCGVGGQRVVFRLSPNLTTSGRQFTVNTFGSNFATLLSVWTGACGPDTEIPNGCNANAYPGSQQSQVTFQTTDASTYYIIAEGFKGVIGDLHVIITSP